MHHYRVYLHFIFGCDLSMQVEPYRAVLIYKRYKHHQSLKNGLIRVVVFEGRGLTLLKGYFVTLKLQYDTLCIFCTE